MHLVLGEGTSLIRADDRGSAHRLAGVHTANKVIGLEHPTHGVCKGKGDCHGKPLRHSNNDERYGKHQRLKKIGNKGYEVLGNRRRQQGHQRHVIGNADIGHMAFGDAYEPHHDTSDNNQ